MGNLEKNKREKEIFKVSVIGIISNVLLSIFKAMVGFFSNSIAIILDAVNNLSDAISSVITIVGMKLALKPADKKHPLGHGRAEYFSSLLVSSIIISAGIASFKESAEKLINPSEDINYSISSFVIMIVAILVKLFLGAYTSKKGEENNSESLKASGKDATFDSIVTSSTLISAIIYLITSGRLNIDGVLGIIISIIIVKSGIEMIMDSIDELLGRRIDFKFSQSIKSEILNFNEVYGVYDLFLDNYGPENYIGFVHIEVNDTMTAMQINILTRKIQNIIFQKYGIALTIGIYAVNTQDPEIIEMSKELKELLKQNKEILQVHGVYIDKESRNISFDIVIDFSVDNKKDYYYKIKSLVEEHFEGYNCDLQLDTDIALTE